MKLIKNYSTFFEYKLNENIFKDFFKKALASIVGYFQRNFGKNAWLYYSLYLVKNDQMPKDKNGDPVVDIICPDSYLSGMKTSHVPTETEIMSDLQSKFNDVDETEEEIADKELISRFKTLGGKEGGKHSKEENEKELTELEAENELEEGEMEEDEDGNIVEHFYFSGYDKVNEDFVTLDFPMEKDAKGKDVETVRNVDVDKLKARIERVYKMNALRASRHQKEDYAESSPHQRKKTHALFIWGAPGIGKTEILHDVANKLDLVVQEWHLATIEPTDFRGIPRIENVKGSTDPKDERTVSKLPAIFPTSDGNGNGGIMFFDELNRAPAMVLSASLVLALSGKHGEYRLPPRWIVIAAGNRPNDIADRSTLTEDPILWNRFAHVNFSPKVNDWVKWAIDNPEINPDLIAFLQFHKHYYHRYDDESKRQNWPSPRTWGMASEVEYDLRGRNWENKLPFEEIKSLYMRAVGRDAALDYIEYLKLRSFYDEDDVRAVYEKGAKAKLLPKRKDQARAAAVSIAFWKKGEKITTKELQNIFDFSLLLPDREDRLPLITYLRFVHPYIKTDSPWKEIYYEWIKIWHAKDVK